jgi:hypothetical protein
MSTTTPPLNELFPAKRERQSSAEAGAARVILTDETRASLAEQDPTTHVAA